MLQNMTSRLYIISSYLLTKDMHNKKRLYEDLIYIRKKAIISDECDYN